MFSTKRSAALRGNQNAAGKHKTSTSGISRGHLTKASKTNALFSGAVGGSGIHAAINGVSGRQIKMGMHMLGGATTGAIYGGAVGASTLNPVLAAAGVIGGATGGAIGAVLVLS